MAVKVITPPAAPLTIEELRLQCRIDAVGGTHVEDAWLLDTLADALKFAQHYTQRSIGSQTLELAMDDFPSCDYFELPQGPVSSITSVKYVDEAGSTITLATSEYMLDDYAFPERVALKYGKSWPVARSEPNAVKVVYVSGDTADGSVKQALKLYVSNEFDNGRGGGSQKDYELALEAVRTKLNTIKRWGH